MDKTKGGPCWNCTVVSDSNGSYKNHPGKSWAIKFLKKLCENQIVLTLNLSGSSVGLLVMHGYLFVTKRREREEGHILQSYTYANTTVVLGYIM